MALDLSTEGRAVVFSESAENVAGAVKLVRELVHEIEEVRARACRLLGQVGPERWDRRCLRPVLRKFRYAEPFYWPDSFGRRRICQYLWEA